MSACSQFSLWSSKIPLNLRLFLPVWSPGYRRRSFTFFFIPRITATMLAVAQIRPFRSDLFSSLVWWRGSLRSLISPSENLWASMKSSMSELTLPFSWRCSRWIGGSANEKGGGGRAREGGTRRREEVVGRGERRRRRNKKKKNWRRKSGRGWKTEE